jgi:hypothetical protein
MSKLSFRISLFFVGILQNPILLLNHFPPGLFVFQLKNPFFSSFKNEFKKAHFSAHKKEQIELDR